MGCPPGSQQGQALSGAPGSRWTPQTREASISASIKTGSKDCGCLSLSATLSVLHPRELTQGHPPPRLSSRRSTCPLSAQRGAYPAGILQLPQGHRSPGMEPGEPPGSQPPPRTYFLSSIVPVSPWGPALRGPRDGASNAEA